MTESLKWHYVQNKQEQRNLETQPENQNKVYTREAFIHLSKKRERERERVKKSKHSLSPPVACTIQTSIQRSTFKLRSQQTQDNPFKTAQAHTARPHAAVEYYTPTLHSIFHSTPAKARPQPIYSVYSSTTPTPTQSNPAVQHHPVSSRTHTHRAATTVPAAARTANRGRLQY